MQCTAICDTELDNVTRWIVNESHGAEVTEEVCRNAALYTYVDTRRNRHYHACRDHIAKMLDYLSYVLNEPGMLIVVTSPQREREWRLINEQAADAG